MDAYSQDTRDLFDEILGHGISTLRIRINSDKGIDKYPAKHHARRVAEQLRSPNGLIVLSATPARNWPNSDMPAPFRQDRYFYYITGCNEPDCYVTYHIKSDRLTLWLPPIEKTRVVWYGRGSTVEEALERYDIDEARYIKGELTGEVDNLVLFASTHLAEVHFAIWQQDYNKNGLDSLRQAMNACRVIKDAHEIERIRRANAITAEAHINVLKGMHRINSEAEVEAAYMQVCIARKAKEQAYDPIAGSGANAAELHYSANNADFGNGQTVVLDAGCEVERYASDVTRTIPINPERPGHWPSREAKQIYDLVEKIQEQCIDEMQPGNRFIESFWHAHEMVIEGLLELGIFKDGSVEDIFKQGTSRAFLPHGLGHHLGLDVHDVSPVPHPPAGLQFDAIETEAEGQRRLWDAFKAWRPQWATESQSQAILDVPLFDPCHQRLLPHSDAPILEPGMVVTVEPGIYFNKFLIDEFFLNNPKHRRYIDTMVLSRFMQVGGVRIEDDILITKTGQENLTTAPKGDTMLKILRESASFVGI